MKEIMQKMLKPILLKYKIILIAASLIIFLILGIGIGAKAFNSSSESTAPIEKDITVNAITVKEILLPASELVSMKYTYTDVDIYENNKKVFGKKLPFTTDKVIFSYDGVINVGVDLSKVEYDVDNDAKRITITLPEPQIMSHEVDETSFKFYDAKNSIFTETKLEDYTNLMAELKDKKEENLIKQEDFLISVTDNAQNILTDLLKITEITSDYTIIYK